MSTTDMSVAQQIIPDAGHEFTAEQIAYIEEQGFTVEQVREAVGKIPAGADKLTLEALLGEVAQTAKQNEKEPNVIDPSDPKNKGSESTT